ncbi:MAG: hypothetical protein ACFE94_07760 [Candidatus Hodarchaeota archaeon]
MTELSKFVRENGELIKIKNKQVFGFFALLIIIPLCLVLSCKFMWGEGTIRYSQWGYFIDLDDTGNFDCCATKITYRYHIINHEDYPEYMQDGLEVHFIGVLKPDMYGDGMYLLYVIGPNEFPPIFLVFLGWAAIFLGLFGILFLLYKVLMIKDKRIYLKSSKSS